MVSSAENEGKECRATLNEAAGMTIFDRQLQSREVRKADEENNAIQEEGQKGSSIMLIVLNWVPRYGRPRLRKHSLAGWLAVAGLRVQYINAM